MIFLLRLSGVVALFVALVYAALFALGTLVTPEPRDIVITLPIPKPKP